MWNVGRASTPATVAAAGEAWVVVDSTVACVDPASSLPPPQAVSAAAARQDSSVARRDVEAAKRCEDKGYPLGEGIDRGHRGQAIGTHGRASRPARHHAGPAGCGQAAWRCQALLP